MGLEDFTRDNPSDEDRDIEREPPGDHDTWKEAEPGVPDWFHSVGTVEVEEDPYLKIYIMGADETTVKAKGVDSYVDLEDWS